MLDADGGPNDTSAEQDGAVNQRAPYPFGLSDQTMEFGGAIRRFRVHVPDGLERPVAVLLVLHGGGGEGMDVAQLGEHPLSVFRTVADREGFVVVYPEGSSANEPMARVGWADCRADNRTASGADDVGFLAALVDRIGDEYLLTSTEIFVTGGSNGAQMTHAFAFHHADRVGAVATGSGSLPETPLPGACTTGPGRPLPILILHGTADSQMPYEGGCVANLGGACNRGRVISAEDTRDRWLELNGLSNVSPEQTVIDIDVADAGSANRWYYPGSAPVEWWRLDGAGHAQPSLSVRKDPNQLTGIQNNDIEFAEIVWQFFASTLR